MTRLIATRQFPLGGQTVRPGDVFDCESRAARTLILTGRAQVVESEPEAALLKPAVQPESFDVANAYSQTFDETTRALEAAAQPEKRKRGRPKGSYKRRDMRAEE